MVSYMMARPFPYNAARFRFAFRLHLVAITVLSLVAVLLLRFSPRLLIIAYLLIIVMVTVVAVTILSALPPVRTVHSVDGNVVSLRQGLNFKLEIPLSKISKAKRVDIGKGRNGIHLDRANGALEVIASGPEAVRLRLNDPVVHKGALVREILVDVLEPREFIECIRERKRGAVLMERMDGGKRTETAPEEPEAGPDEDEPEPEEEEALPSPPPIMVPKTRARLRPPPGPEASEEPPGEPPAVPRAPPKSDDEDEIELVPAFPSKNGAQARVVRIPKRKT